MLQSCGVILRKKMRRLDENVYVDREGNKYVKIRESGYELYGYLRKDGFFGWCGGFVGPEAGWRTVEPSDQTKGDVEFKLAVESAPYVP